MKITFLKTPKPRRFNHVNIYYNPDEEERQEREVRINKELGLNDKDKKFESSIKRGTFRKLRSSNTVNDDVDIRIQRRNSNIRFIVIAIILIAIAFVMYYTSGDFLSL